MQAQLTVPAAAPAKTEADIIRDRIVYQFGSEAAFTKKCGDLLGWTTPATAALSARAVICAAKAGGTANAMNPLASHSDAVQVICSLIKQLEAQGK